MFLLLDIGCGENKRDGAIGIDITKCSGVDIVADARCGFSCGFLKDLLESAIFVLTRLCHSKRAT